MFDPATLAIGSLALTSATAVLGFAGQQQAAAVAQEQANLQARGWERNQVAALAADRDNQTALLERQMQEGDATGYKLHAQAIDRARRIAEAEVAGASMGTGGTALNNLTADIGRRAEDNRIATISNWNAVVAQLQAEKLGSIARDISRTNAMGGGTPPVEPSVIPAALRVGGAGLKYFADTTKQNSSDTYTTTTVQ